MGKKELKILYRIGLITKEVRVKMSRAARHQRGFSDINSGTKFPFS